MAVNVKELADRLSKALADEGRVVAAGWQIYRLACLKIPPHEARDDLREAFEAGAEHLFGTMMSMLDPGTEETPADMARMDRLNDELKPIRQRLQLKYGVTMGRA
jgi:hypothetical protein